MNVLLIIKVISLHLLLKEIFNRQQKAFLTKAADNFCNQLDKLRLINHQMQMKHFQLYIVCFLS